MSIQYENISSSFIASRFPHLSEKIEVLQNSWMGAELSPYTLFYDCIFKDIVISLEHSNTEHIQEYFDFVTQGITQGTVLCVD